jgi:repressor LexA
LTNNLFLAIIFYRTYFPQNIGEVMQPKLNRTKDNTFLPLQKTSFAGTAGTMRTVRLPVVGRTFAGQTTPIPSTDFAAVDAYTTIEVREDLLPAKRDYYFVLEVRGDSMIEAGIFDGDYIICRKSETAQNNEKVVALLTDTNETTVKTFFRESDHIRLQPANSSMQPIRIHDTNHLIIQGVVVKVVHCCQD